MKDIIGLKSEAEGTIEISESQSLWLRELRQTCRDANRTLRTTVFQAEVVILSVFLPLSLATGPQACDRARILLTALFATVALIWGTATLICECLKSYRRLSRACDKIRSGRKVVELQERPSPITTFCLVQFLFFSFLSLVAMYSTFVGKRVHVPAEELLSSF